jgi:hypothetical protein
MKIKPIRLIKREKYAVLLCGGWNSGSNYERYWNDLQFIFKTLKTKYGYSDSEIIVLYANGTHNPNGTTVNADANGDGKVSMKEAHNYAKNQDSRDEHPVIGSCVSGAYDTTLFTVKPAKEDCICFNPAKATVVKKNNRWKIVDGGSWLFDFGSNKTEAAKALNIIKHYSMNQSCYVGRPDPSFQYMLARGKASKGALGGQDCLKFNLNNSQVKKINNRWKIVDGNSWLFDFGNKKDEAVQAFNIIKKYGFSYSCYVGRPDPSFKYLRK